MAEVLQSIAGVAFLLIDLGIILTIVKRWKQGELASAKKPVYLALHYGRFLSWIVLGALLLKWAYMAGRIVAIGLIPIMWLQMRDPRPKLKHMLLASGASLALMGVLALVTYLNRDALMSYEHYFELGVAAFFVPQIFFGNVRQIRQYRHGKRNGESRVLHLFVAINAACWAIYFAWVVEIMMSVLYGAIFVQEVIMIRLLAEKRPQLRKLQEKAKDE